jgi:hypothetical protein
MSVLLAFALLAALPIGIAIWAARGDFYDEQEPR